MNILAELEKLGHAHEAEGLWQGLQLGIQVGMQQGQALALQKLLTNRFGVISSDILAKLACATPEQIDTWLDQILDAKSLGDMFGSSTH